ncbi:condensation domain-containing protein [Streptomyces coeruleorubidus]|uniref:condensation domain-containing protein n=1 Tax=Streptomyces coeruleorubidus TaxID=116188 RepID=UPI0033F38846
MRFRERCWLLAVCRAGWPRPRVRPFRRLMRMAASISRTFPSGHGMRRPLALEVGQRTVFDAPRAWALARIAADLRRAGGAAGTADPGAGPRTGGEGDAETEPEGAPLTSSQLLMWLQYRMAPTSVGYNEPVVLRLRGDLVQSALEHALRQVVRRHEALRVTISTEDGHPTRAWHRPAPPPSRLCITDRVTRCRSRAVDNALLADRRVNVQAHAGTELSPTTGLGPCGRSGPGCRGLSRGCRSPARVDRWLWFMAFLDPWGPLPPGPEAAPEVPGHCSYAWHVVP